jgi:hypothetical protein
MASEKFQDFILQMFFESDFYFNFIPWTIQIFHQLRITFVSFVGSIPLS